MKKSLIIHAAWSILVVISFVVGAQLFSGDSKDSSAADGEGRRGAASHDGASGNYAAARGSRSTSRNNQSSNRSGTSASGKLSERGIKLLGNILKTSNDPIERRIAFSKILESLTNENAELLREQIIHMSDDSSEWKDFHYAWGALGGQSVVEFGSTSEKKDVAAAFSGWASANPQAALAWLSSQPENEQNRRDLKWGAVYGLANTDPSLATQYAMERNEAGDKDAKRMMGLVANAIMKSGNPAEAARWASALPEGNLQGAAVAQVARTYAKTEPGNAVTWLDSLPDGDGKSKGLYRAYSTWAQQDAAAAGARLNQMGDSVGRDAAVDGYSRNLAYQNPQSAVEWANSITDPRMRSSTMINNGRIYMRRNPEAARQWLAGSNLSPDIQSRITRSKKQKR